MGPPVLPNKRLTLEKFLEFESASPLRHEFVAGEVYAMEGASRRHNTVVGNIHARLRSATPPCEVYFAGLQLRVGNDIYYPDVLVT